MIQAPAVGGVVKFTGNREGDVEWAMLPFGLMQRLLAKQGHKQKSILKQADTDLSSNKKISMFKSSSKRSDSDFFQDANFKITPTQTKLKLTNNIHKWGRLDEITSEATFILFVIYILFICVVQQLS